MYQEPILERYGTFREVTQGGAGTTDDPFSTDPESDCVEVAGVVTCIRES
jgi:hypothetical protein